MRARFKSNLFISQTLHLEQEVRKAQAQANLDLAKYWKSPVPLRIKATFVHIRNISTVTDPILTIFLASDIFGALFFWANTFFWPSVFWPTFFWTKFFRTQTLNIGLYNQQQLHYPQLQQQQQQQKIFNGVGHNQN